MRQSRWSGRILTALTALAACAGAFAIGAHDRDTTAADLRLVEAGHRSIATILSSEEYRGYTEHTIDTVDGRRLLHTGWIELKADPGERIDVVLDPADEDRALLADPDHWTPDRAHGLFLVAAPFGLAIAATWWVARRTLDPEDILRIAELGKQKTPEK